MIQARLPDIMGWSEPVGRKGKFAEDGTGQVGRGLLILGRGVNFQNYPAV